MAFRRYGFTLLELLITVALLAVVSLLGFVAVQSSVASAGTAAAKSDVQQAVRDVMAIMVTELQTAAKADNDALNPPLDRLAVTANPAANCPIEVSFQVPLDGTARNWSNRIRFRHYDEDANNNEWLDSGEDVNGDGVLTRCIWRMEDTNGDGTPDETREVGGANCISNVQFVLNGNVLTITLTATQLLPGFRQNPVTATTSTDVYLLN
ncbi:MAG: hypothetical protein AMXMBFR84_11850 [Candidatus Hydrogenedentota bacterium]